MRLLLSEAGAKEGLRFRFRESGKGEDGLAAYHAEAPDCIMLDYHLPDMDGMEFLTRLKVGGGGVPLPVVLFTGSADRSLATAALRGGAQEYLPKRFMAAEMLLRAVQSAQDRFKLHTAHRRIERVLLENEARLRLTQEAAQVGNWDWEMGTDAVRWSPENFALHGMAPSPELVRHAVWQAVIHPDDRIHAAAAVAGALASGEGYEIEYRVILEDGGIRWLSSRGSVTANDIARPRRLLGVIHDITSRRRLAEDLIRMNDELERRVRDRTAALAEETRRHIETGTLLHQAQKMEVLGQLTGVIAHDFNNFLHIIKGNLVLAQRGMNQPASADAAAPHPRQRPLDHAMKAVDSAAQLSQRLLAFGRRQILVTTRLAANSLVASLVDMIRQTIGANILIETALAVDLWPIMADGDQLEAALLNIVVNARDAMPSGGRIMIETSNASLDGEHASLLADAKPGQYILLRVTDSGSGIPKDVMKRIFEPFFTTKSSGHGTGLGLAMVYGFIKQSGGHVRIESNVGEGTTIAIYLPRLPCVG